MPKPSKYKQGFTLIEIILSLLILSFVLSMVYGALIITLKTQDTLENYFSTSEIGPAILQMVAEDFKNVFINNEIKVTVIGKDQKVGSGDGDSIYLVTTKDCIDPTNGKLYGISEVSYFCKQSNQTGANNLYKRIATTVDEDIKEGGISYLIYDKIGDFNIEYFDGETWSNSWDEELKKIPKAIRISLMVLDENNTTDILNENNKFYSLIVTSPY